MPLFAIAHMYAFSHTDYIDPDLQYAARMPLRYAFRDAFGFKDVVEDSKATLRGEGMDYRAFEPVEGKMHQGSGRDRRIKAGLRYSQGGKQKYWLPMPDQEATVEAGAKRGGGLGPVDRVRNRATGNEDVNAPLFEGQARDTVRIAPDLRGDSDSDDDGGWDSDGFSLTYSDPHASDDELYAQSRSYLFGDYNYPCIDVSGETARRAMWDEEERILRDQRAAFFSPSLGPRGSLLGGARRSYGATVAKPPIASGGMSNVSPGGKVKGKDVARRRYSLTEDEPLDDEQIKGAAVIDMESDRIPDLEVGGVKLRWSKAGKLMPDHQRRTSPSPRPPPVHDPGYDSFSPASESHSPRSGPSSPSRQRRRLSSPHPGKPLLPADAVDLVVEDPEASAENMMRERRKGEPAVQGQVSDLRALRKVYQRGYKAQDIEREVADVEVSEEMGLVDEDENGRGSPAAEPRKANVNVARGHVETERRLLGDSETIEVTDITALAASPPLHAGVDVNKYELVDGDNPWL